MTFTDKTFIHAQKKALGSIMFRVSRYGQLNYILRYIHYDKDQKVATHQHVRYKPNLLRFPKYGFGYQRLSLVSILSDLCSYSMIIFKSVFSWKLREAQTFLHRNALFMLVTHPMEHCQQRFFSVYLSCILHTNISYCVRLYKQL